MLKMNYDIQSIARKLVKDKIDKDNNFKKQYKATVKSMGSMIIQNGLYGTLVFYKAKSSKKEVYDSVYKDIFYYLKESGIFVCDKEDVLEELQNTDLPYLQEKVLEFANWYRRFVDIYIPSED